MDVLCNKLLENDFHCPSDVKTPTPKALPEKVLQIGEGNFLRGFADWMINELNNKGLFNGSIIAVQPTANGRVVEKLNRQDGLYTLLQRGILDERVVENKEIISSISRGINPYADFDKYMKCAEIPTLRIIISNTTEAGIAYNPADRFQDAPPSSFPGKLTVFLYRRFKVFAGDPSKGFIILPCELIDKNGDSLKSIVIRLAQDWELGCDFIDWISNCNFFLNTLVDRIVTGFPTDEAEFLTGELGYKDELLDTSEIYHLWVIEGNKALEAELPLSKGGLNAVWADDITPYKDRKVGILNGAHTMTALAAYLYGMNTVKECMDDQIINTYIKKGIYEEIIPALDLPETELKAFAADVLERFANPFIKHNLLGISLNSVSKFKARILPSVLKYIERKKKLPKILSFSMAALIAFYYGTELRDGVLIGSRAGNEYSIKDSIEVLEMFRQQWSAFENSTDGAAELTFGILSRSDLWGMDLNTVNGFAGAVSGYLYRIMNNGASNVIRELI